MGNRCNWARRQAEFFFEFFSKNASAPLDQQLALAIALDSAFLPREQLVYVFFCPVAFTVLRSSNLKGATVQRLVP